MSSIHDVAKRAGVSTATVSRALSRPDLVSRRDAPHGPAGGQATGLHAELRRQASAHAAVGQLPRHRAGHLQPVFLVDSAGNRGRSASQRVRGARRRHAARPEARGAVRDDVAAPGSRRPDLPRPSPAEAGGSNWCAAWRRDTRRWSTAASSAPASACRACTSTMPPRRPTRWTISIAWAIGASAS